MSLVGKTIGRYRIIEQLGQGGMAVVYKAFDTRLERDVAVKVIRTEDIPPSQLKNFLQRFEREAKTQSKFNHPNIVHIHDYGEHEGAPYLVMAYSPGGTLQDLTGTPMPYSRAAALLAPIADALTYAHKRDVLHRDVKPSNILISEENVPSLTDFGIAKLLGEVDTATLTGTGMGIGTPQYMAPEQWKGKPEKATDIYALGVVFYELVTGRKPYDAETPAALVMILATEPLSAPTDFVPDLPEHVEKVLYKALAPAPEDRYENMAEFAKVLDELRQEEVQPAEAKPTPLPQTEVMLPIEEQAEEPAKPEPTTPEPIEPVVPTLYPQEMPTEATPLPVEPEVEEEPNIPPPPKPKTKFKMPVWGWGLIGLIVLAGIVFGGTQMGGGSTPVAEAATETVTEINTNHEQPTVTIAPTNILAPTETLIPTAEPTQIGGGSGKIVFASDRDGDMEIYVMNADGSGLEQITDNDVFDGYPVWSPDGSTIAYVTVQDNKGQLIIWENGHSNTLLEEINIGNISWSCDDDTLYGNSSIASYITSSSRGTKASGTPIYDYDHIINISFLDISISNGEQTKYSQQIEFNDLGRSLVVNKIFQNVDTYVQSTSLDCQNENILFTHNDALKIMDDDGYITTLVRVNNLSINYPSYSPIQDKILISSAENIFSVNMDGTDLINLAEVFSEDLRAKWSPDGTHIIFSSNQGGDEDIFIMDADGSNIIQLTDSPGFDGQPDWQPAPATTTDSVETPNSTEMAEPPLGDGSTMTNPIDSAVLSYIPAGNFLMGNEDGGVNDRPVESVYLDAFWIYQTEVTNQMYQLCVLDGVCEGQEFFDDDQTNIPVSVSIDQANAYCEWAGGTIPNEAQWEKAARGGLESKLYPWGNEDDGDICERGAFAGCEDKLMPVGSYPPNNYGLYDMAGNEWEWAYSWDDLSNAIPKGGNIDSVLYYARVTGAITWETWGNAGFRCVIDIP